MARRENSRDPRAVRTRAGIIDVVSDLLATRRGEQISVSQIVAAAATSRQVFYDHFDDRDAAVLAALQREVVDPLLARSAGFDSSGDYHDILVSLFSAVEGKVDMVRNVLDGPVQARLELMLRAPLQPLIRAQISRLVSGSPAELSPGQADDLAVYLGGGVVATFLHCLQSFTGVDEAAQRIATVLSVGLSSVGRALGDSARVTTPPPKAIGGGSVVEAV